MLLVVGGDLDDCGEGGGVKVFIYWPSLVKYFVALVSVL